MISKNREKMKKNIFEYVGDLLKTESKYTSKDGKLLKTSVYNDIMTMNEQLLSLLLSDELVKERFFKNINGTLIFDKQKFAWFIESKEFLPDSYTRYINKIGLTHDGNFISKSNDIVLDFPYKDCFLEGKQDKDDQKRKEIFYNEIIASDEINRMLAPKVFTNAKRYTKNGIEENITFNEEDNLIIKGNNLIALASLLKIYEGKVKCIYIDPPYNTRKDSFNYNDSFNHSTWLTFMKNRLELSKKFLREDGVIFVSLDDRELHYCKVLMDEIFGRDCFVREIIWLKGNAQNDAKNIQKNTESILVYTKNVNKGIYKEKKVNEVEVFEENNRFFYKGSSITTGGEGGILNARPNLGNTIYYNPKTKELIGKQDYDIEKAKVSNVEKEVYRDDKDLIDKGFIKIRPPKKNDKLGCWTWSLNKINDEKNNLLVQLNKESYTVVKKEFLSNLDRAKLIYRKNKIFYNIETEVPSNNTINISSSLGSKHLKNLFGKKVFENPKNEHLIEKLLNISTMEGDLVMDFYLGTGTTSSTAHKMKRKYIGIEQMDYIQDVTIERMKKVIDGEQGGISKDIGWNGGGSFIYCELMENSMDLLSKIAKSDEHTISIIKNDIYNDSRLIPYILTDDLKINDEKFEELSLKEKKDILIKLIDKNKLYVHFSDIDDITYHITENDKIFNKKLSL